MSYTLPTDPVPYAAFIAQHLMQPVAPDARHGHAVTETEHPVDGDHWFWADDNAKVLEFLALPALWQRFPDTLDTVFRFLESLCDGPFIFRRTGHPRLERVFEEDGRARFIHTFMAIECDLPRGIVSAGMRFHDGRTARNAILTGNYLHFTHAGVEFALDVEDAVADWNIDHSEPHLTLRHTSELSFENFGCRHRLGRLTYTYRFDARSMFFDVEAELELDEATPVSGIVLTIGQDELSHNENGVHYGALHVDVPGTEPRHYEAMLPEHSSVELQGAAYWSMTQQDEMRGFALGIHSIPSEPQRLVAAEVVVKERGRLHCVVSQYRFPEDRVGGRIRIAERKLITSGGFYDRVAQCSDMVRRHAAAPGQPFGQPLDLSISYDYGAEIAAVARCYRLLSGPGIPAVAEAIRARSLALFERFHAAYSENLLAAHRHDRSAIFSRPLAFVASGLVDMWLATGDERHRQALREAVDVLLEFEKPFTGSSGRDEAGFVMGLQGSSLPYMDCHAAALLALIRALPVLDDPSLAASIDRGLGAFQLATLPQDFGGADKADVVAVDFPNPAGGRSPCSGFWNFCTGLALRCFNALRTSSHPALQEVAARHRLRMDILQVMLEQQIARSLRSRGSAVEILTSHLSGEGNSETQPWVALGLLGAAGQD